MRKIFYGFWIVLFFVGIIVPLFHMNTSEITEQENRTLAKFPEIKKKDKPNYEFGKEFESWLGDRFWGRDKLIDTRFQTMYKINGRIENDQAFIGDDGWMFEKHGIVDVPSLEKQYAEVKKSADILKRFDDKFKGKNIPIYLVLIPDRNEIYQKYWEKYYTPKPRIDQNEELIKQLADHPNIHIIYPKKEFIKAMKTDDLFYKDDIHLTSYGNFQIIKKILENFPSASNKKVKNKNHISNRCGNISRALNYARCIRSENVYNIPILPHKKITEIFGSEEYPSEIMYTELESLNRNQAKNLYIMGICYARHHIFHLTPFYNTSYHLRLNLSKWPDDMRKNQIARIKDLLNLKKNTADIFLVLPAYYDNNSYLLLEKTLLIKN